MRKLNLRKLVSYVAILATLGTLLSWLFSPNLLLIQSFEAGRLVKDRCTSLNKTSDKGNVPFQKLHVIPNLDILFCHAEKVASRSLLTFFLKMSKPELDDSYFNSIESIHDEVIRRNQAFLRKKTAIDPSPIDGLILNKNVSLPQVETGGIYEQYLKVVFVRNPLDRLLSAWMNRFIDKPVTKQQREIYKALGLKIIKKYRPNGVQNGTDDPTLREFFLFLKDGLKTPTELDRHWKPMHLLCNVCNFNYQFIGKLENIQSDAQDLLHYVKPQLVGKMKVPMMRPPGDPSQDERYITMRHAVERPLAEAILNAYATDYYLFDYNLQSDLEKVYS